jgi:enamine deaminase RidA (YjgF/YER057c/UK114 family)
MSSIERIHTKPTYSEAVIHNGTVYLSGQVPWVNAEASFEDQCEEVFANIDARLQDAGSDKKHILSMQVFLVDPEQYALFNVAFLKWMPAGCSPARNTICGIKFPNSYWDLEIVVVAAVI